MKNFFLLLLFPTLLFSSCKQNEKIARGPENVLAIDQEVVEIKDATEDPNVFATLQKTPCFGTCPFYSLVIYKTGKAFYQGVMYTEPLGKFNLEFSKKEMEEILKKAEQINYFALKDEYDQHVSDFPSTITSLRRGITAKRIKNRVEGPAELKEYETFLEKMLFQKVMSKGK
jgi:hypothetical protein